MLMVLNGIGGIGKTELVKEFVSLNEEQYVSIAWINILDSFKSGLINAFQELYPNTKDQDELFKAIIEYLYNLKGDRKLLVLDNLSQDLGDDYAVLKHLSQKNWCVLMTSRVMVQDVESYDLLFLDPDSAKNLFYSFYKKDRDDKSLTEILKLSGFHTLSIELLAKTANENRRSLKEYSELLNDKGFDLSEAIKIKVRNWKDQQRFDGNVSEHLLKLYDEFDLQADEIWLLKQYAVLPPMPIGFDQLCQWLKKESEDQKAKFYELHLSLVKKGFLREEKSKMEFSLHRVLIWLVQKKLEPKYEDCDLLVQTFIGLLHHHAKTNPVQGFIYIPYAKAIANTLPEENNTIASLNNNLAMIYKDQGILNKALSYQKKTIEIQEKILDKDHPTLATSYNNLAMIYKDQEELDKALSYQKKTTKILEKVLDKDHPYLATSYSNLASIYQDQEELDMALSYQKKALEIEERVLDKDHPDIATSYSNLASIYQDQEELDKALSYQNKATEIREKVLDKDHPKLAKSYNNLAMIYESQKKYHEAITYIDKAIVILQTISPNGHPKLSTCLKNKANFEKAQRNKG